MPNPPGRAPQQPQYYTPMWQSPILLGAVAALVVLSIGGWFMYVSVQKRSEEKQYDAAMKEIGDGQYPKAIKRFDALLTEFPEGVFAEKASVWRGIAQVKQFSEGSTPAWVEALNASRELTAQFKQKAFFKERSKEVGDLLAKISAGLATQAKTAANPDDLAKSNEALKLLETTVEAEKRPTDKIAEVMGLMDQARFEIEKASIRKATVAKMDEALAAKDPIRVFVEHRRLYHRYADLRDIPEIRTRRDKARALEQTLVVFENAANSPSSATAAPPLPSWTLARRLGESSAKATGAVAPVLVADVLYGLDAGSGKVLWRLPTGYDPAFPAVAVGASADKILLHASAKNSLMLLEAATGKTLWNRSLGSMLLRPNSRPAFLGDSFYLVGRKGDDDPKGRLAGWSLTTGDPIGEFVFPQPLAASAAVDASRNTLLVAGDQSSLYVVDPGGRKCERVMALDHEPDAIRTPPVIAGRFLFLMENLAKNTSRLRCLALSASDGAETQRQVVPLTGWCWHPPATQGGRLFVTTAGGRFAVFELGGETDANPLSELSRSTESTEPPQEQDYPLAPTETDFWTIGLSARRFSIAAQGTQATPAAEIPLDGQPYEPPGFVRGSIVVASKSTRTGVVMVQGIHPTTAVVQWKVELGSLADSIRPSGDGKAVARIKDGESLAIPLSDLAKDQIAEKPFPKPISAVRETRPVLWQAVDGWSSGAVLWTSATTPGGPSGRLLFISPEGVAKSIPLPAPPVAPPVVLNQGVLASGADGMLFYIDPKTGAELAEPFAAPYAQGKPMKLGAVAARDDKAIILFVGGNLLKLELVKGKVTQLREVSRADTGKAPITQLVLVGTVVVGSAGRELLLIDPTDLKIAAKLDLGDSIFGPLDGVGSAILARTRSGKLLCVEPIGGKLEKRWIVASASPPVGPPALFSDRLWLASADGRLQAYKLRDGSGSGAVDAGRALDAGPWKVGDRLVVEAVDGSLLSLESTGK